MKNLNQIERIKVKLRLAKNTDSFFEVFGADSHQYVLSEPASVEEVEIFERKYSIKLPLEYCDFLTKIGNGGIDYRESVVGNSGAGPDYGIFKLGNSSHFMVDHSLGYLKEEPYFNSKITKDEWYKLFGDITDDEYDKVMANAYRGILAIGFSGCAGYMGIMLTGNDKGKVLNIYDELEYCPNFVKEANFLDWYENWLDQIISGLRILSNEGDSMSESECFDRYLEDEEPCWKIVSLGYIRSRDSLSGESIDILWSKYCAEGDEDIKLYILNLLAKFDYQKVKNELNKLYLVNPIEFLKILHLYAPNKTSEWQSVIQELQNKALNFEVAEYIKYVTIDDMPAISN